MDQELTLRIILEQPPAGVDYGIQKGSGNNYETVQTQRSVSKDLHFEFAVRVKISEQSYPNFLGPYVHGTPRNRFLYIDIGTCAGQADSVWTRRLKIPLTGITPEIIHRSLSKPGSFLETHVPGTGRDAGPNCATVKPFKGWSFKDSAN